MSLFNTLNSGASGMGASSTTLSVIGDNLANLGTVGFKSSSATFADTFPNMVSGLGGPSQVGTGAMVGGVALNFGQGSLNQTGSAMDVAVLGSGFFAVSSGEDMFYTRDGSFHLDADSFIVNTSGLRLQGYQAIDGRVTSGIGDLQVDGGSMPQKATEDILLSATLSADADATSMPFDALRTANPLDGSATAPTLEDLSEAADFSTSVTIYDSLGMPHDVIVFFERDSASPDTWNTYAVVDGGQVDTNGDGIADGVAGSAFEIGAGTVQFDTDGNLMATTGIVPTGGGWTFPGAGPFTPTFQIGMDAAGNPTGGELRMTGTSSFLTSVSQDGYAAGTLDNIQVEEDGTIVGSYSNGSQQDLGQIATATVPSTAGLERVGGNLFRATERSGDPALGVPGSGARGSVHGYALEGSNVEMEDEFVAMIQAQRSYQANTGVIRTADEALQQLINLV